MNILEHYVLDSASPAWLREMVAIEDEANAQDPAATLPECPLSQLAPLRTV